MTLHDKGVGEEVKSKFHDEGGGGLRTPLNLHDIIYDSLKWRKETGGEMRERNLDS